MLICDLIKKLRSDIRKRRFRSEADVSQGIVLAVLDTLGWPVFNTRVVSPQFLMAGQRVDYALCHPENTPRIVVEVKDWGMISRGENQVLQYAASWDVPFAVVTDGQLWAFYLCHAASNADEKKLRQVDLLQEEQTQESIEIIEKYLRYDSVCSGDALRIAEEEYRRISAPRIVRETLPKAWDALIGEPDSGLMALLAEKVNQLCNIKPEISDVSEFLKDWIANIHSAEFDDASDDETESGVQHKRRVARQEGNRLREQLLEDLRSEHGIVLKGKSKRVYLTKSGNVVGIPYSSESSQNTWFFGLPEDDYYAIVFICMDSAQNIIRFVVPKDFCRKYKPYWSRGGHKKEQKFQIKKSPGGFEIVIPHIGPVDLREYRDAYDYLKD